MRGVIFVKAGLAGSFGWRHKRCAPSSTATSWPSLCRGARRVQQAWAGRGSSELQAASTSELQAASPGKQPSQRSTALRDARPAGPSAATEQDWPGRRQGARRADGRRLPHQDPAAGISHLGQLARRCWRDGACAGLVTLPSLKILSVGVNDIGDVGVPPRQSPRNLRASLGSISRRTRVPQTPGLPPSRTRCRAASCLAAHGDAADGTESW